MRHLNGAVFGSALDQFRAKTAMVCVCSTLGTLRYGDHGLRTTAGRALSFIRSTGLSRANIER